MQEVTKRTQAQRCPICDGHGFLRHGFYLYPAGQDFPASSTEHVECRSCGGRGWFVLPEEQACRK